MKFFDLFRAFIGIFLCLVSGAYDFSTAPASGLDVIGIFRMRPGNVKMHIEDSAPGDNRTLDRDPPKGWLGSGETKKQGE